MKKTITPLHKARSDLKAAQDAIVGMTEKAMLAEVRRVEQESCARAFLKSMQDTAVKHFLRGEDNLARVLREAARRGWDQIFPSPPMMGGVRRDEEAQR